MEISFSGFVFNEATVYEIKKVNGVSLPDDYLRFMHEHDGGEGDVGENAYIQIFRLEELESVNEEYEISDYMEEYFIWGTDLGGMLFGYSGRTGMYSAVDSCSLCEEDIICEAESLTEFLISFDRSLADNR